MSLARYILKRFIISLITVFVILVITFFITRALPGDPAWMRLPPKATLERYYQERARLGLDEPLYVQLFIFMGDMLTGNWGVSWTIMQDMPVWTVVMQTLPKSLEIMFISFTIAVIFGILLGKTAGAHQNSKRDYVIRGFSYLIVSIPAFIIIIFLIQIYVNTRFTLFPLFGYKTLEYPDPPVVTGSRIIDALLSRQIYLIFDYLYHLVVPIAAMVMVQVVIIIRQTRASMIDTMEQDYIRTARAKGCSNRIIINRHALKNAAPPAIIASGMGFAIILGGLIAVERIYQLPGLGNLFYDAVRYTDYSVVVACVFVFSIVAIVFNFISDVIIAFIDPRIRLK